MKDSRIQIRLSAEKKEALKNLADKENRSVSNYIEKLIDTEIKKNERKRVLL